MLSSHLSLLYSLSLNNFVSIVLQATHGAPVDTDGALKFDILQLLI